VADIETKRAVVGKRSDQVTNGKDRRYSCTHERNLPGASRRRGQGGTGSRRNVSARSTIVS
jgi:hypothetical protein